VRDVTFTASVWLEAWQHYALHCTIQRGTIDLGRVTLGHLDD